MDGDDAPRAVLQRNRPAAGLHDRHGAAEHRQGGAAAAQRVASMSDNTYGSVGQEPRMANPQPSSGITQSRVAFAVRWLKQQGILAGKRSHKLSARVDPGLLRAARERLGESSDTEVVNAALGVLAGGGAVGAWVFGRFR